MVTIFKKSALFIAASGLLLSANLAVAATTTAWKIVPSASNLNFSATQNNAPVTGEFNRFSGDIDFDPTQLAKANIKIIVDMNSIQTIDNDVASTLKTADWFNSSTFPQAVFIASHFTTTGLNTYQAKGMLTIRDKTVPVVLNFTMEQYTTTTAIAKGVASIERTQFGVGQGEWANTDTIKDAVTVNFVLTATK